MGSSLSQLFVVDADSHWSEPADLFTRLAPADLKDRVPHHEVIDGERMWVMDGVPIGQAIARTFPSTTAPSVPHLMSVIPHGGAGDHDGDNFGGPNDEDGI
jgi:hypothetical protein